MRSGRALGVRFNYINKLCARFITLITQTSLGNNGAAAFSSQLTAQADISCLVGTSHSLVRRGHKSSKLPRKRAILKHTTKCSEETLKGVKTISGERSTLSRRHFLTNASRRTAMISAKLCLDKPFFGSERTQKLQIASQKSRLEVHREMFRRNFKSARKQLAAREALCRSRHFLINASRHTPMILAKLCLGKYLSAAIPNFIGQ
ncbi:hypothetical protein CDAR_205421 [Caerostris darwini]|uniref:Uncharacterized protein n=1 Tax=Caerostris darwini TaxID=1538125 RepID=A0AAV4WTG2_9ARAC|nr:hypothetical protein CDAR_205421 [Caerostris darwini]